MAEMACPLKRIPIGITNWEAMRKGDFIYVDKTKAIEVLEKRGPYVSIHRPRSFGKSLFASQVTIYYDIMTKEHEEVITMDLSFRFIAD